MHMPFYLKLALCLGLPSFLCLLGYLMYLLVQVETSDPSDPRSRNPSDPSNTR